VPTISIDGINTRYQRLGSGPALLMFSPGGFDARLENWSGHGIYQRIGLLARLAEEYTCILFDRRESGASGGRVERLTWAGYADQGAGLLDQLGIERAHLIGGCVGCSVAALFAVRHPDRTAAMVLYSPAGGARYRLLQHARFAQHQAFVATEGTAGVVRLAAGTDASFSKDPRVGPWCTVIRTDAQFAESFARLDPERYLRIVAATARTLFDRDSVPGPEPEDLLGLDVPTLVVPGQDSSHATSAARFLQECLSGAQYWDVPVEEQTEVSAPARVLDFLASVPRY